MLPFFGLTLPRAFTVTLSNANPHPITVSPTDCTAGFRLGTDGKIYTTVTSGIYTEAVGVQWLDPKDPVQADLYECLATVTSGTLTTGTAGSWLALTSDRTWTKDRTSDVAGTDTCIFTLAIRQIGTTNNLASATITLDAEVTV